jgi:L-asparaginase
MQRGGRGYEPAPGYLARRLAAMPEFADPSMPEYQLHEYEPLLDSADMHPHDWERLARDIEAHYHAFDGFVILHGTDTMAYTASALSFMLEHLAKPVMLTGSQIPLAEVRSDARENLITAMLLAADYPVPEVCLYFSGALLRGNRSTKVSAGSFTAFASPNFAPLGTVGVEIEVALERCLKVPSAPFAVRPIGRAEVGTFRLFPGVTASVLRNVLRTPLQGLVLQSYGSGNAPLHDREFLRALEEACERGVVIVNCSQCLTGRVEMAHYATGRALHEVGVVSGFDMTPEAALSKLSYLLSQGFEADEVKVRMQQNLRGELTP